MLSRVKLVTEPWVEQRDVWPASGRHILAQWDDASIVVYQAYRPEIAAWAVEHQRFGGPSFSFDRMSWIKPNFLWMMYRCGWNTKAGQERTLAVRITRAGFDAILAQAVHSSPDDDVYGSKAAWKAAVTRSSVRLQWDPDHSPGGAPLPRRAIQLGLRDEVLRSFGEEWIVDIEDITPFVAEQRVRRADDDLRTPRERVYPVNEPEVAKRLGVSREAPPDVK